MPAYIFFLCKLDALENAARATTPLLIPSLLTNDKHKRPQPRRGGDEVKNYSPWLGEMELSVGWSRLVCSRQWRVKEITPSLCQQPWPRTHKNIMRKDMLGLQGGEEEEEEEGEVVAKTGGRPKFGAFFAGSDRRKTASSGFSSASRGVSERDREDRRVSAECQTCHFLANALLKKRCSCSRFRV